MPVHALQQYRHVHRAARSLMTPYLVTLVTRYAAQKNVPPGPNQFTRGRDPYSTVAFA